MAKIFVCGDVCNYLAEYSREFISKEIIEIIKDADYSILNLEGIECPNDKNYIYPHQKDGTINYLKSCGFDMCQLANNHITDGGKDFLLNTISKLDDVGLDYLGAGVTEQIVYAPVIKKIKGYNFGFFNVCEAQVGHFYNNKCNYGYAWLGHPTFIKNICELRKKVDFIICLCHFGLEHYETPLSCVRSFYRQLIEIGVDCIVGSHPHIAQGFEFYKNKLIVYSVGNFFFPRKPGLFEYENHSYSVLLDFEKEQTIKVVPILHELKNGIVQIDNSGTIDIEYLNSLLLDEKYSIFEKKTTKDAYNNLVSKLLYESMCSMDNHNCTLLDIIKNIFRYSIFRLKYVNSTRLIRYSTLSRLFNNEVYKYIITENLKF